MVMARIVSLISSPRMSKDRRAMTLSLWQMGQEQDAKDKCMVHGT